MNFEGKRRRAMGQLPRHVSMLSAVRNVIGPTQLDIWKDTIGLTSTNINCSY